MITMTPKPSTLTSESLTLVNYVEVWTLPTSEDDEAQPDLQLDHAYVIDSEQPRRLDASGQNKPGEGIAGSAWKQKGPVILEGENSSVLQHVNSVSGVPIKALLAIPVYNDYTLVNVVVFGLTAGHGGVEVWSRDDRDELAINGAYYEGLESFRVHQPVRSVSQRSRRARCMLERWPSSSRLRTSVGTKLHSLVRQRPCEPKSLYRASDRTGLRIRGLHHFATFR